MYHRIRHLALEPHRIVTDIVHRGLPGQRRSEWWALSWNAAFDNVIPSLS